MGYRDLEQGNAKVLIQAYISFISQVDSGQLSQLSPEDASFTGLVGQSRDINRV